MSQGQRVTEERRHFVSSQNDSSTERACEALFRECYRLNRVPLKFFCEALTQSTLKWLYLETEPLKRFGKAIRVGPSPLWLVSWWERKFGYIRRHQVMCLFVTTEKRSCEDSKRDTHEPRTGASVKTKTCEHLNLFRLQNSERELSVA